MSKYIGFQPRLHPKSFWIFRIKLKVYTARIFGRYSLPTFYAHLYIILHPKDLWHLKLTSQHQIFTNVSSVQVTEYWFVPSSHWPPLFVVTVLMLKELTLQCYVGTGMIKEIAGSQSSRLLNPCLTLYPPASPNFPRHPQINSNGTFWLPEV